MRDSLSATARFRNLYMLKLCVGAKLPMIALMCVFPLALLSRAQDAGAATAPATAPAPAKPDSSSAPATPRRRGMYPRRTLDQRVQQLTKSLDLNEKQQIGLKEVLERQQAETRRIQFDQSLSGEERTGRFRALQENTVLRIRGLLNDEQKAKYDPLSHGTQDTSSSQSYVDQWMKNHERTPPASTPPQK